MKYISLALFTLVLGFTFLGLVPVAHAQAVTPAYSLLDFEHRLTVGARVYRSFDERLNLAGSYSSAWWAGVPVAYIITGAKRGDGSENPLPISAIAALDISIAGDAQRVFRGYVGIAVLLKKVPQ